MSVPKSRRAKKAARKRAAKKSAKPKSRRALKRKRDAAVEKRKQTLAANKWTSAPNRSRSIRRMSAARAAIAKRQVRGRRTAIDRADDPPPATGIALVERVTRAVERELSQIEVIVGGHHVKPAQRTEAERRARTLASLARTLTEVRKLRADEHRVKPQDDPDRPRDLRRTPSKAFGATGRTWSEEQMDHPTGKPETGGDGLPD